MDFLQNLLKFTHPVENQKLLQQDKLQLPLFKIGPITLMRLIKYSNVHFQFIVNTLS